MRDLNGLIEWIDPGVRIRFLPDAKAAVMEAALSPGLAMKNDSIGIDVPGVAPPPKSFPRS